MITHAIRRILVAVSQPSAAPSNALIKAAQLAQALKAELLLFHAIEIPLLADAYNDDQRRLGEDQDNIRHQLLHELEALALPLRAQGLTTGVAAEWDFPAGEAVLRHAAHSNSDLLVIGQSAHARTHSTVAQLIHCSPGSVLLVKTPTPYEAPVVLAAVSAHRTPGRPQGLDGQVYNVAQSMGKALRGSWSVVKVRRWPGWQRGREAGLRAVLPLPGFAPRAVRRATGRPCRAILDVARMEKAQIIVLGASGTSAAMGLMPHSTLQQIIERAPQDVLVIKPESSGRHFSSRVRGANILSVGTPPVGWHGPGL